MPRVVPALTSRQTIGVHRNEFDKLRLRRGAHSAAVRFDRTLGLCYEDREVARRMASFVARHR